LQAVLVALCSVVASVHKLTQPLTSIVKRFQTVLCILWFSLRISAVIPHPMPFPRP
jgi:hypothetical protein